jgi:ATP-dependent protease ClpP protease subunit
MVSSKRKLYEAHTYGCNFQDREIFLHSFYSDDGSDDEPGVDYRQATTFIKNLLVLDHPPYDPILVHLHSMGGCWQNGMAMFNVIETARSPITMLAYAQAMSMSGILFQSAPVRVIAPDAYFMMHHGWSGGSVHHPFAIKEEADYQIKACRRMLEIFAKRAVVGEFFRKKKNCSVKTAYRFFDKKIKDKVDWYITADEAVFYGLADGMLGTPQFPDIHALRGTPPQT